MLYEKEEAEVGLNLGRAVVPEPFLGNQVW